MVVFVAGAVVVVVVVGAVVAVVVATSRKINQLARVVRQFYYFLQTLDRLNGLS